MAFDSEEKKSDFESWAEDMTYQEEKEFKKQEKLRLKAEKKAEKQKKKQEKLAAQNKKDDEVSDSEKADEDKTEEEKTVEEKTVEEKTVEEKTEKTDLTDESEDISESDLDDIIASDADDADVADSADSDYDEDHNSDYVKKKKKDNPEEINIVRELLSLIIYIGVVIILCYLIITYVGQRTTVNGRSMENTLQNGDNLWIDKLTYHFKEPERFDIIVFPYEDDVFYIKRVIGLPGETVQILQNGTILIDGEILMESYGREIIDDPGTAATERTLGEDEYFVLGDNRNDSRDSRWADVGNIKKENIVGRAVLRLTPFSNFGSLD